MQSSDDTQLLDTADFIDPWSGVPVSNPNDELVGTTLNGTYVVERLLGEGGMGRVYLAQHTRIKQKRVALKVLLDELGKNEQVLARFQREAEAAAAISHPNVVSVLDVAVTPRGLPYLVCEYLEGIDLSDYLKDVQRLNVVDALSIARQLCRGLGAAHARGVVHRDLKPANIFLVGDFKFGAPRRLFAKVLDFGLSRFHGGHGDQNLTKTGFIMGTPSYMAPEQARGERVDHRADIYGLGAVLYALLTGRTPFEEETPQAIILALLSAEPPRPRSLVPSIPPQLELVIERAMSRNPAERFQDMAAFEQALDAIPAARSALDALQATEPARAMEAAPRARVALASDADIRAARPRLLFTLLATGMLIVCAATTAISGVELAIGHRFGQVELRLILLGIVGSAFTPTLLWFLHVKRRIWNSSSRVLGLLSQLQGALLAGIVSYGLLLLGFHVVDDFLLRFLGETRVAAVGVGWVGWNLLLPVVAFVAAVAYAERRRLLTTVQPGWQRLLAVWFFTSLATGIAATLVYLGLVWRAGR